MTKRTAKIYVSKKHKDYNYLLEQMVYSKEIYNYINFLIRQKFFQHRNKDFIIKEEIFTEFPNLTKDLKTYFKGNVLIPSTLLTKIAREFSIAKGMNINTKVVTNVVRKLFSDWKSFFKLLEKKKLGFYDKNVSIPKYKKSKYNLVEYNLQTISRKKLEKHILGTFKMQGIKLLDFINPENILSFRSYYKNSSVILEIIYEKEVEEIKKKSIKSKKRRACSADLGLDILMALTFNFDKRPLNVDAKYIKSVNQYFNKEIAKAQSQLPENIYTSRNIQNLYNKREAQIRNYFGLICNKLADMLKENRIEIFVIGYNKEQKQGIGIGKRNNQNFVQIPFYKLRQILKYKLEEEGIMYVEQEESYTSKASFLDNDEIPSFDEKSKGKHKFSGKRIKRGLYKSKEGKFIHADTNGSFNIMRKADVKIPENLSLFQRNVIIPLRFV